MIMELFRDVAVDSKRAVIVVTHDNRVFEFGNRIAHMDDGHIERVEENNHASPADAQKGVSV